MITSFNSEFAPGDSISGKWHGNQYRVQRLLGQGANGRVYLVHRNGHLLALKIGFDPLDLQLEVNVLRTLLIGEGSDRRYLVDVDDAVGAGKDAPFYVMKFVKGKNMLEYIRERGADWIFPIGLNLLRRLAELHRQGFVFGDLKPENVIVSGYGEVELIDFGGVTQKGRAVRQFTELYDRGFWNAGSRIADEAYDLFSFAILCMQLLDKDKRFPDAHRFLPQNRGIDILLGSLQSIPTCRQMSDFLEAALNGSLSGSTSAYEVWKRIVHRPQHNFFGASVRSGRGFWIQTAFMASLVLFGGTVVYCFS